MTCNPAKPEIMKRSKWRSAGGRRTHWGLAFLLSAGMFAHGVQAQCLPVPLDRIAWWPGTSGAHELQNGNHGTQRNGATVIAGYIGEAFHFDGADDYVSVPEASSMDLSRLSAFTIETWIRPEAFNNDLWPTIFSEGSWRFSIGLDSSSGKLESYVNNGSEMVGNAVIPLNEWTHVAVVWENNVRTFYINGVLDRALATGSMTASNEGMAIGGVANGDGRANFQGDIDELSLYSRALSQSELLAIYQAGADGKCEPATSSLRAVYVGVPALTASITQNMPILGRLIGDENAFGFTLEFNPTELALESIVQGAGIPGAFLTINTNQAHLGRIGVAGAILGGGPLPGGIRELVVPRFQVLLSSGSTTLSFSDALAGMDFSDTSAQSLPGLFEGTTLPVIPFVNPQFTLQPTNITARVGDRVELVAQATGTAPITLRWLKDGQSLPGGDGTNRLVFTSVALTNAGSYVLEATNSGATTPSATAQLTVLPALIPPSIIRPPLAEAASEGESVDFRAEVAGSEPLFYQWLKGGVAIPDQTNLSLTLPSLISADAGAYSIRVTNTVGNATSSAANLTVAVEPRGVTFGSVSVASGGQVNVPVLLRGFGNENAVGFSLDLDTNHFSYVSASLGADAAGGFLAVNEAAASSGRVGLAVTLPTGQAFPAGVRTFANVRLQARNISGDLPIGFADSPVSREIADVLGRPRASSFTNGLVTVLSTSPEVLQSPQDLTVPIFSNAQLTVTADGSAPLYFVWRQDGNAVATTTAPVLPLPNISGPQEGLYDVIVSNAVATVTSAVARVSVVRQFRSTAATVATGNQTVVPVQLLSGGRENALGFSLQFDPARLVFLSANLPSALSGAALQLNTNQAASGRVGIVVSRGVGEAFLAGTQNVVEVLFEGGQTTGPAALDFTDAPTFRELVNTNAEPVPTSHQGSVVQVTTAPPSFTSQPQSQEVPVGAEVTLSAQVAGSRPMSFQWLFNGLAIPGATTNTLVLSNVQTTNSGQYRLLAGNAATTNSSAQALLTVVSEYPDIRPLAPVLPASVAAGEPVQATWITTNAGTATAVGPWIERIYLLNEHQTLLLKQITHSGSLVVGAATQHAEQIIIPANLSGVFRMRVDVDTGNQVREFDLEGNNSLVGIDDIAVLSPDLDVVSVLPASSSSIYGQPLSLEWQIQNTGQIGANGPWVERVYLSSTSNSITGAILLGEVSYPGGSVLGIGATLTNILAITPPLNGSSVEGDFFVVVSSDHHNRLAEASEANNRRSAPLTLTLPPLPDLTISQVLAPTNALPGQSFPLVWQVRNDGSGPVSGRWTETLRLDGISGSRGLLASLTVTNDLAVSGSLMRTQQVVLPLTGPAGNLIVAVEIDVLDDQLESNEANNRTLATNATAIPHFLSMILSTNRAPENGSASSFLATVSRNGELTSPLSVTLENLAPDEISLPGTVQIPAGGSSVQFPFGPLTDGISDGDQLASFAARASGFTSATGTVTIVDINLPELTLSLATNMVEEGDMVPVTVSRTGSLAADLTVQLASSNTNEFFLPPTVVIPAGSNQVMFAGLAVEDVLLEVDRSHTLTASAPGYIQHSTGVLVVDDDFPLVTVTVEPAQISEGAGGRAAVATATRAVATAAPVRLSPVVSDPQSLSVPSQVTIPAFAESVSFYVAALDDAVVDGDTNVLVGVQIRSSDFQTIFGDGIPDTVTVQDDDSPLLTVQLSKDLVGEGIQNAAVGTVSRNIPGGDLTVNLLANDISEIVVPGQVIIPSGSSSVTFPIHSQTDGVTDGSQIVTITASASGFSSGQAVITVSDANRSDLIADQITVDSPVETEANFNIGYRIYNQGIAAAASNWVTKIYLSKDDSPGGDTLIGQQIFTGSLPVGDGYSRTLQFKAPSTSGTYWIVVETDADRQIEEILESNNAGVSLIPLVVNKAYTATVSTETTSALAGTAIQMTGSATRTVGGGPAANVLVNIHLVVRNTTRIISALTDSFGNFNATFHPLPNEAGNYTIGAAHPGDATAPVQDAFALIGFRSDPALRSVTLKDGESVAGNFRLVNLSEVPITGMNVQILNQPSNVDMTATLEGGNTLSGNGEKTLSYTITALSPTTTQSRPTLRVTSAEGAQVDIPMQVIVNALRPRFQVTPSSLVAGMTRGQQTVVEFEVVNSGGKESGPVQVLLPDFAWLTVGSTNPIPNLLPGETNRVTLLLTPPADIPLGPYNGQLALSSAEAVANIPFTFRALSDGRGDLLVRATDEFTYYSDLAPLISGAEVVLRDAFAKTNVVSGLTDTNGLFHAPQLLEGYYDIEVRAEKHKTFRGSLLVTAGETNDFEAFLPRETVKVTWTVERIEIEDRYEIKIETQFETAVPAPVITVTPSVIDLRSITADVVQFNMRVENHGLIAAEDFRFSLPEHPCLEFELLVDELGTIPARSSLTVPLTIRRVDCGVAPLTSGLSAVTLSSTTGGACNTTVRSGWSVQCGKYSIGNSSETLVRVHDGCGTTPSRVITVARTSGNHDPFSPSRVTGEPGPGSVVVTGGGPPGINLQLACDPECLAMAILGCIPGPIGCAAGGYSCGGGLAQGVSPVSVLDCLVGAAGCAVPGAGVPACLYSILRCIITTGPAASGFGPVPSGVDPRLAAIVRSESSNSAITPYKDGMRSNLDIFNEIVGSVDGVWLNASLGPDTGTWFNRLLAAGAEASDGGRAITLAEEADLLTGVQPAGVGMNEVQRVIARWNRTYVNWQAGIEKPADAPMGESLDFMNKDYLLGKMADVNTARAAAQAAGYGDLYDAVVETIRIQQSTGEAGGVCARVKLVLDQEAVLTRDAFRATLELENNDSFDLENINVRIIVRDETGLDVTELFAIRDPEINGIPGGVTGGGTVGAGATGSASWVIIPTVDAAPTVTKEFEIEGVLEYRQEGNQVGLPLAPAPITVYPSPRLYVKYFHQRDVLGDDPFTTRIEPTIPFNLAVLVENQGFGEARNFKITSAQPKIVENEKGLLIDFKIIATEVAGQNLTPSLTAAFGNIQPGDTSVGRWLMTSSLQGLFTDYEASFEHVDGLGNSKLSLIDEVTIHEMVRLVRVTGPDDDGKPDFLVNQVADPLDLADTLYQSDGSTNEVALLETANVDSPPNPSDLIIELTTTPTPGWSYLRVPDPGQGNYLLKSITRSDGKVILVETNAWLTDRTFIGVGRAPQLEDRLHLLDLDGTGSYTIEYAIPPESDLIAPQSAVQPLAASSGAGITLQWDGSDNTNGTGIAFFDIFVSQDNQPFQVWRQGTLDRAGIFTGTFGSEYQFYSIATDRDGNREAAPASADAFTLVDRTNRPPVLVVPEDLAIAEGQLLTLNAVGTDPDGDGLTYSLLGAPPQGLIINPLNGLITWATGEGHGPSTNLITVSVLDDGFPRLGTTESFSITVSDINSPPTLRALLPVSTLEGNLVTTNNLASDIDLPAQTLTFSLGTNAPAGATIDPVTGFFSWTPNSSQGGRSWDVPIIVTDDGTPAASTTVIYNISVEDGFSDLRISMVTTNALLGQRVLIPIQLETEASVTSIEFQVIAPGAHFTQITMTDPVPGVGSIDLTPVDSNRRNVVFSNANPPITGTNQLAMLQLDLASADTNSAVIPIILTRPQVTTSYGGVLTNTTAAYARLFAIGHQPLVHALPGAGDNRTTAVYGQVGWPITLQGILSLDDGTNSWSDIGQVTLTNQWQVLEIEGAAREYRRAYRVEE